MPVLAPPPGVGVPTMQFLVAFYGTQGSSTVPASPNDPTITPTWIDLSSRLLSVDTKRGKSYELDEGQSNELTFKFNNKDGALDPTNTAGPYYPYILPKRAFKWTVTWNSVTYTLASGFIDSWPQTWRLHGYLGEVEATGSDALGALSQMLLPSCLAAEILLDNPLGYWPLGEPSGSVQGANDAATSAGPMVEVQYGTGGTAAFGGTTLTGLVGAGASNGLTGPVEGDTTGVLLTPASSSNGLGLEASFNTTIVHPSNTTLEMWVDGLGSAAKGCTLGVLGGVLTILVDSSGNAQASCYDGTNVVSTTATLSVIDGKLHHIAATLDAPGQTLAIYVDGTLAGSLHLMNSSTLGNIANFYLQPSWSPLCAGTFAQIAAYTSTLSGTRITAHYNAGVNAFPESTGNRFERILRYGPWNLGVVSPMPNGDTNLAGLTDCEGKSVLQALLDVCTAEGGNLYANNLGTIVFENRHARMTQVNPVWTLGENPGEQPYQGDIEIDFDDTNVFNTLVMQRPGGASYNFFDAVSLLAYFSKAFPTDPMQIPIDTDQNLFYMGQFLVNRYKQAFPRVAAISFNPTSNPSLWAFVGTVEVGQRVKVNRRPRDANPISIDCFVESVSHHWDANPADHTMTLELSPAGWQNYQLLTAARGSLHTGTLVGATSFVVDVIPTAGNTLAQDGWQISHGGFSSPSYGIEYIEIVDGANSETLQVLSITTSGSQATVTTAVGAAHAHAATVVVAEAFPAGDTYNQFDPAAVLNGLEQLAY